MLLRKSRLGRAKLRTWCVERRDLGWNTCSSFALLGKQAVAHGKPLFVLCALSCFSWLDHLRPSPAPSLRLHGVLRSSTRDDCCCASLGSGEPNYGLDRGAARRGVEHLSLARTAWQASSGTRQSPLCSLCIFVLLVARPSAPIIRSFSSSSRRTALLEKGRLLVSKSRLGEPSYGLVRQDLRLAHIVSFGGEVAVEHML